MATILVTGASGFVGGHLAEALVRRGERVRCLVRRSSDITALQSLDVELIYGDVTDASAVEAAVRGSEVVFHAAGLTKAFRKSDLWAVNEEGTANVSKACAQQSTPPVHVYVSSIAAGGPTRYGNERVESEPSVPVSNYGRSKLAGERAAAAQAGIVPTTIVRPGIVFGPRNRECLPIFTTIDRCGVHPVVGFRTPPLSYIHVDQLIDLLLRVARSGSRLPNRSNATSGQAQGYYHASIDEFPTYADFGRIIGQSLGRSYTLVVPLAMPVPWIAAAANELIARCRRQADHFNIDKIREASVESWACSSKLAQRDLRFQPSGTLLDHLQETVEWYRERGWLRVRQSSRLPGWPRLSTTQTQVAR